MIPKKIHYVHINPLTKVEKKWIEETRKNNPDYSINIWNEKDTKNLNLSKAKIILKEGGFCISQNIVFTKKIPDEWLLFNTIVSKLNEWELSTEIIGGTKNNRFFKNFIDDNITQLVYKIFGRYSITNSNNNKLIDSKFFKCLEKPKLFPDKLPKHSPINDLVYIKRWDNVTNNNYKLNVIEL